MRLITKAYANKNSLKLIEPQAIAASMLAQRLLRWHKTDAALGYNCIVFLKLISNVASDILSEFPISNFYVSRAPCLQQDLASRGRRPAKPCRREDDFV